MNAILSATRCWMLDTRCWSYRVSTPIGADTDTGCWILDAGLCGSGSKRPMRRSTETDIATTPALPSIEHPVSSITHCKDQHSNTPAFQPQSQQHRHYPASSIQYRASLTANISIPTLQHSNTPAFQRRAQRHWHYPVSSIQYRASLTAKIGIPAAASSVQHPVSNIATCKRSHITRILRVILHPSYLSQIKP